jgi:hypothetical protein
MAMTDLMLLLSLGESAIICTVEYLEVTSGRWKVFSIISFTPVLLEAVRPFGSSGAHGTLPVIACQVIDPNW